MRPFLQQVTMLCYFLLCLLISACNSGKGSTLSSDVDKLTTDLESLEIEASGVLNNLQTKSFENPDYLPSLTAQVEDVISKIADSKRVISRNQKEDNVTEAKVADWKLDYADIEKEFKSAKDQESGLIAVVEKVKDTDQDGVPDDIDQCLTERGPARNNGCPEKKIDDKPGSFQKIEERPKAPIAKADPIPVNKPPAEEFRRVRDSDGDGLLDNVDRCPNEYGTGADGCPPKFVPPPPPAESSTYTRPNTIQNSSTNSRPGAVTTTASTSPISKPASPTTSSSSNSSSTFSNSISCNSSNSFSPIDAGTACSEIEKSGGLIITPKKNVAFSSFYLVGDDNGTIEYKLMDSSGKKLNKRSAGRVNAGPGLSQMSTGNIQLKANKTYTLSVKPTAGLKLKTHSCDKVNFTHPDVKLSFSGEPFIYQINFCK